MRSLKVLVSLLVAALFAVVFGNMIASYFNASYLPFAAAILLIAILMSGNKNMKGVLRDGVYTEVWLGELVKRFRFSRTWLARIPRYDQYVKNKVIHLVDVGADPNVYLNLVIDTDNPVPTATRTDDDIPFSLDRWDTENTRVSAEELRAITYDKMATTLDLHMNALADKAAIRAAWRLAPASGANIVETTGGTDGRAVAKKMMTPDDIVHMSEIVSTPVDEGGVEMPSDENLIAVLDYRHVSDLQKKDQLFDKQWRNAATGELFPYNGWMIYKFTRNAKFQSDGAGGYTKKAFGAALDPANDLHSSLFFYATRAFAAADSAPEMFYRMKENDPEVRSNTVGFRQWSVVGPKKLDSFFSLVSPKI